MFAVLSLKPCLSVSLIVFLFLIFLEKKLLNFSKSMKYLPNIYFILFYHLIRTFYICIQVL